MFRHRGKGRTNLQNLGIAALLSFVAGIVNIVGFLQIKQLTTNVTGHFAFMIEEALKLNFSKVSFYFFYIFFFFLGAFFSNFVVEVNLRLRRKNVFIIPALIETILILFVALLPNTVISKSPNMVACTLLFAMGLQNSLVTTISNAVVRTTHLTGLFTDLGIEFSQLLFYGKSTKRKLWSSIKLRLAIITSFFVGGVTAGLLFGTTGIRTLLIAAAALTTGIFLDYIWLRIKMKKLKEARKQVN